MSGHREIKEKGEWIKKIINTDLSEVYDGNYPCMYTNGCIGFGVPIITAKRGTIIEAQKAWEHTYGCKKTIWIARGKIGERTLNNCEICEIFLDDMQFIPEELFKV